MAPPRQTGADGAFCHSQRVSDLRVRKTSSDPQGEHIAFFLAQSLQRTPDNGQLLGIGQPIDHLLGNVGHDLA